MKVWMGLSLCRGCVSVCSVVPQRRVSLQQPQEKWLLEQPAEWCAAERAADFQPHVVWNRCTSPACRYSVRLTHGHLVNSSDWTICWLRNYFINSLPSHLFVSCPDTMLQSFRQELAAQFSSFQKGKPVEEYGLSLPHQQTLVYEWVMQRSCI